ncbi:MAG: archease [Armatimonadota bacterium]
MQPFYPVEHTADVAIVAQGRDMQELCRHAALGMFWAMAEVEHLSPTAERMVEAAGETPEQLLMDLLRELHFLYEVELLLFTDLEITEFGDDRLKAVTKCAPIEGNEEHVKSEIKAVTYHGLEIEEEGGVLRAQVVFDI